MENKCETKASCREKMIKRIKSSVPEVIGIVVGAAGGFIYYRNVGCSTGSCLITSNPWLTILWGAMIGYLAGSMFNKKNKKK